VGTYQRELVRGATTAVALRAQDLTFGAGDRAGPVYLTVDGYERAFTYRVEFELQPDDTKPPVHKNGVRLDQPPALRIVPDRFGRAGDKVPVRLEVDDAEPDVTVELGVDRNKDGQYDPDELETFTGPRERLVSVDLTKQGGVLFKTVVHDWKKE